MPSRLLRWSAAVGIACAVLIGLLMGPVTSGRSGAVADDTYRVDVIFDSAKGIIPGQLVKIAGARVGMIDDVVLTPDFKARIQMKVDRRFAPFRADARCEILPEGLISERFVQCEPGTPDAKALEPVGDQAATVPVENTSSPVAITDLFNIFQVPVRQRFSVIVATLGIGFAGRGEDLNEVLRRANPTLDLTRKALTILGSQRAALRDTVTAVDKFSADLAKRPQSVTRFLDDAAAVANTTAQHQDPLQDGIRRLPGFLDEMQTTFARLNEVADAGTPVLRDLRAATPGVSSLVDQLEPFSDAAKPALTSLSKTSKTGRATLTAAKPVVKLLRTFANKAGPTGQSLNALLVNLQERGGVENLLSFVYHGAAAAARYDSVSHLVPAHIFLSKCSVYSETPIEGCSAKFGATTTARKAAAKPKEKAATPSAPQAAPTAPATPEATAPAAPQTPSDDAPKGTTIQVPGLPPITLPALPGLLGNGKDAGAGPVKDLLQYLLGS
ncbi:MlaD family protein [Paraconexibacter sp. AEG42_29]